MPAMTAPVRRYTAAEREQAAHFLERLAGDWEGQQENALRNAAAMLRQAAAEGQVAKEQRITTRCPSCGTANLFIGEGGHLTCSLIGCPEPGVGRAIAKLAAQGQAAAEGPVKRCGTCRHFNKGPCVADHLVVCGHWQFGVPADGSGFCHLHSEGEK